jgi:uncharacterized membrane protein YgaE (UPF0421/DUF939 family)
MRRSDRQPARSDASPEERPGLAYYIRRAREALANRHIAGIVVIAGQAGIAAALSWAIAKDVLGRDGPVFAPLTSLATIAAALGHRARQVIELLVGVGVGISIADGLLVFVDSGAWQIALVVFAAVAVGLFVVGRSGALVSQAGGTATLFATLTGSQGNLELPRIIDAGVGTSVGFLVFSLLLPLNPFRAVDRAAEPLFATLTSTLDTCAEALRNGSRDLAGQGVERLTGADAQTRGLNEALDAAEEVVTLTPWWRHLHHRYERYRRNADEFRGFLTEVQVLTSRAVDLVDNKERKPAALPQAVVSLSRALTEISDDHRNGRPPDRARDAILDAADQAAEADSADCGLFCEAVMLQVRSSANRLLRATGVPPTHADRMIPERPVIARREVGKTER